MPSPGDKISHYKVISAIGKGGMGEVYLAEDTRLERHVALKILLEDVAGDNDRIRRFIQEAKAASALNHPNILTVYEIGEYENSRYIATELIKGETLRDRMHNDPIGLNEAMGIALQVAASLAAAHDAGILHRDIKPENIMIRNDGLVKVLDFGLAKLTEKRAAAAASEDPTRDHLNTQPGLLMGTVAYMSPEQVRGRKLDARSDIFSVGIVMYELFTGKFPFDGEGHVDLASSILKDEPQAIRQLSPGLPRQLERIVDKALRKDRENRYQHVKDLQIDLEDLRDELKFEAKQTRTTDQQLPGSTTQRLTLSESISTTRRFTLLHAFLFAVAAGLVVGAVLYFRPGFGSQARVPGSYKTTEVATWSSAPGEIYSSAKFSPDGKMIAFASTKSGSKNIWVTQAGSSGAIQVTNDTFANTDPIWSPKGDEIAYFVAGRKTGGDTMNASGIWRVPALGGSPRLIAPIGDGQSRILRWTQSGKIYYRLTNELHAVDLANGVSQKVISLDQGRIAWMDVSTDERSIAYAAQNNDTWRIVVSDISGNGAKEVAAGSGKVDGAVWLPEKNRLFYTASVGGVLQVFVLSIGPRSASQITASETDASVVDASPDGKAIVVTSAKEESNIWRVGVQDGQELSVSRDISSKIFPAISPRNDKVVFQSEKNLGQGNKLFETAIVVKDLAPRSDAERPAQLAERGFLPAWSPDGAFVAFLRQKNAAYELVLVNGNGGSERTIASGIVTAGYSVSPYNYVQTQAFAWSPDGSHIAYVSKESGTSNLWLISPAEGSGAMLTNNADSAISFFCPIWSPDGKRLAYYFQKNSGDITGLRYVETGSKQGADVYETPKHIRLIGWSVDGAGLIIAERANNVGLPPETTLKRISLETRTEKVIAALKNAYFYNIFLSDDRKIIAYAVRNDDKDDLWIIPSAGGAPRKLTANNDNALCYSRLAWLHDGSAIVFGKQTRFSLLSMITDID